MWPTLLYSYAMLNVAEPTLVVSHYVNTFSLGAYIFYVLSPLSQLLGLLKARGGGGDGNEAVAASSVWWRGWRGQSVFFCFFLKNLVMHFNCGQVRQHAPSIGPYIPPPPRSRCLRAETNSQQLCLSALTCMKKQEEISFTWCLIQLSSAVSISKKKKKKKCEIENVKGEGGKGDFTF